MAVIFWWRRSYKGNIDESFLLDGETSLRRRSQSSADGFRNSGDDMVVFSSFLPQF